MTILKKRSITIALLSCLLVSGINLSAHAKQRKKDNRQTVVNVAFKPNSESALTNYVYNTVNPDSSDYHHYLSSADFGKLFGQSSGYLNAFKKYFSHYHLRVTSYPGNLAMKITGTKNNVNQAFKASYVKGRSKPTRTAYHLPGQLAKQIVAVIGLFAPHSAAHARKMTPKSASIITKYGLLKNSATATNPPVPNTKISGNDFSRKYGPLKFANRYHLTDLYKKGLEGQGQRIGIISANDFQPRDIKHYWHQVGVNASISQVHRFYTVGNKKKIQAYTNEGMSDAQLEATLDVQSSSSLAPKANIDVYIGQPTNNATTDPSVFYTAFMTAVSANIDKQLTTSFSPGPEVTSQWGDHSSSLKEYNQAFNLLLEQAAAQGISVFQASGDHGPNEFPSSKENLGISTSPYQVIVGGTTLPYTKIINQKLIKVTKERAWGDTYSLGRGELADGLFLGGGGGFSALNPTPRYQQGVPGVNTFRAITLLKYLGKGRYGLNHHPKVITGHRHARNLPDVSGNADIHTGYAAYISGNLRVQFGKKIKVFHRKIWGISGGTSFTTPQMAAANAVMNSGRSTPIGFWNPQIYKFAQQADTPFNVLDDAVDNNNLYYTGQPGKFYNQATGLGTINFEKLSAKFNNE